MKKQPEPDAANIVLELEIYIECNLSIFADHTNVDTNKRFLVYDIRDLGKQLRTFGMVVVMDQIWNRITRNRAIGRHTWLYIDEMQLLYFSQGNFVISNHLNVRINGPDQLIQVIGKAVVIINQ